MLGTRRVLHSATLRSTQRSLSRTSASMRETGMVEGALTVRPLSSTLRPTPRRPRRRTSTYSTTSAPSVTRRASRETGSRAPIVHSGDALHLPFDPLLDFVVHAHRVA